MVTPVWNYNGCNPNQLCNHWKSKPKFNSHSRWKSNSHEPKVITQESHQIDSKYYFSLHNILFNLDTKRLILDVLHLFLSELQFLSEPHTNLKYEQFFLVSHISLHNYPFSSLLLWSPLNPNPSHVLPCRPPSRPHPAHAPSCRPLTHLQCLVPLVAYASAATAMVSAAAAAVVATTSTEMATTKRLDSLRN